MIISEYFTLTARQAEQFAQLDALYRDWNSKINVISRKDIDNLYEHHVLHSLAIAKFLPFQPGTTILDVGTGGGFPGIPLAILFPECQFVLIDSIRKKILVATEIAKALGLTNVICKQERAEEEKQKLMAEELEEKKNAIIELMGNLIDGGANKDDIYAIISKHNGGKKNPSSVKTVEICDKIIGEINETYKEKK